MNTYRVPYSTLLETLIPGINLHIRGHPLSFIKLSELEIENSEAADENWMLNTFLAAKK